MRFLLDQNLSPQTTLFLKSIGIDAVDLRELGLSGKSDEIIYAYAVKHDLVIMTYDLEFSHMYLSKSNLKGLMLLRIHPQTIEVVHDVLKKVFTIVSERQMKRCIVVVERHRVRIRKVP